MLVKEAFVVLASSFLAAATTTLNFPPPSTTPEPISQCNTGDAQCCNTVTTANDPTAAAILQSLAIVVEPLDVLVGLACTPITVIGVGGGANCAQQPVCCENNQFNGLINLGCTPISL